MCGQRYRRVELVKPGLQVIGILKTAGLAAMYLVTIYIKAVGALHVVKDDRLSTNRLKGTNR